ncbi:DNA-binding CsgD family transcriptional regulator [Saccharothrix coeruleofusca]|uniref:helix-turn-helix transcriptional regulator n=1 Tax=Saccharothrix coeruleofusca TaxID=33919 RepID=UPI001FD3455B|nr:helix-turn-helix transcriptional regulator [Saccharothrix coeruleofusca]MBP2336686.1 DNA-binding CsgD family transcriptional regulator [Saccharothrix coeruleofusca]
MCADSRMASALRSALEGLPGTRVRLLPPERSAPPPERLDVLLTDDVTDVAPPPATLVLVVSTRDAGPVFAADMVLAAITAIARLRGREPGTSLSQRERQVLRFIADGLTQDQTARKLGISPHTVDTYVKRVRGKLGLGNKADLVRAAMTLPSAPETLCAR